MMHGSPDVATCRDLLRGITSLGALKRELHRITPDHARTWLDALYVIVRAGDTGIRVGSLAELMRIDPSVASRKVADLEAAGLAERRPDPLDGRAALLHATDAGATWLDETLDAYADHLATLLTGWTRADTVQLAQLLHRLDATLADHELATAGATA